MRNFFSKIFFWTYPRGSWQYDLICLVILAFIFLTPSSILDGSAFEWTGLTVGTQEQASSEHPADLSKPDFQP